MFPFCNFAWPCISCNSDGRYDKHFVNFKAIKEKIVNCRQSNNRFAKPHFKQYGTDGVLFYEMDCIALIIMWTVFHLAKLLSALCRLKHRPYILDFVVFHVLPTVVGEVSFLFA